MKDRLSTADEKYKQDSLLKARTLSIVRVGERESKCKRETCEHLSLGF